jgi:signal transduction histidine kinase
VSTTKPTSRFAIFSAYFAVSVGVGAVAGWYIFDARVIDVLTATLLVMPINTAVCFVLAGLSTLLYLTGRQRVARLAGGLILLIAGLTLVEIVLPVNFDIDQLLFPTAQPLYSEINRMSSVTALNLCLLGIVFVGRTAAPSRLHGGLMLVISTLSSIGLLAMLYHVTSVSTLPAYQSMALSTAITFLVVAMGYFITQPSRILTILKSQTTAGFTGRRLLPLAIGAPALLGWAFTELTRFGVFDPAMGFALFVLLTTAVFVFVISRTMSLQYAEELLRQAAAHDALEFALHRERNRLLNEFVTNTLHDLRTPLSSIGTSAYIAGRIEDAAKRGERLEHIQTEVRQIGKLLDQFAEMVRLNQMEGVVLTPLALNPIVVRAAAEYQVLAERKGVRVVTDVFPGELVAPVSDLLLQTALIQVLNNAVRYTPSGGLITLRTHCWETHALIEIADTGEGIPAAALQRVFDVQYKGNTARTADGSTGGIGLSMVKRILELHHGRVDISSTVGHGTTVSLIIPIHTPNN